MTASEETEPGSPDSRGRKKARSAFLGLLFLVGAGTLAYPLSARGAEGDINPGCDSLYSAEAGNHTVWDFFSHPCPPAPQEDEPVLPGVGLTLLGIWAVPTTSNPLGFPVSQNNPILNSQVINGYGGGLTINGWFTPNLALRFELSLLQFPGQAGFDAFQVMPITLGFEIRLLGSRSVFLYLDADGGIAINGQNTANIFTGTAGSPYVQVGVGLNVYFLEFEADYATVVTPLGGLSGTNPFFFVPLTVGVHL